MNSSRFDIAVKNRPARDVFLSLMALSGENLVLHPDITGNITLSLKQVSLPAALEAIRDVYGYDFERRVYGYQILPAKRRTRMFQLNYLNVDRQGKTRIRVSSGNIDSQNTGTEGESSVQVENSAEIDTESRSDFWADMKTMLASMVDPKAGGSVVINPQSGMVVVRGSPDELRNVEAFLKAAENSLHRQVILEAKIIEVTLSDGYQQGVDWQALADWHSNTWTATGSLASETLANPDQIGGVFSLSMDIDDFNGVIEMLETQGDVSVLSSPRVATVNNQKAVIKVGQDEFFVTDVTNTTTSGVTTTQTPEVTLTPFFSGIALDVTPQISGDDEVILHVHPSVSKVEDQTKTIDLGSDVLQLPLALSSIRETDTIIKAANRQIVVIGGLISDSQETVDATVPVLGKIPLLRFFFSQKRVTNRKTELVILLKPVVNALPQWQGNDLDYQLFDRS